MHRSQVAAGIAFFGYAEKSLDASGKSGVQFYYSEFYGCPVTLPGSGPFRTTAGKNPYDN